jgi:hypothetical protein
VGADAWRDVPLPPKRPSWLGTYDLLDPHKHLNPAKRTIAFLDNFDPSDALPILGTCRFPHGESSATAAEQNGYNVLRLQPNYKAMRWHYSSDYSKPLTAIYENTISGNLKLRHGDVLNISMGQPFVGLMGQPSIAEANDFLHPKTAITRENLNDRSERAEILAAMKARMQDPETPQDMRERLRQVVETNQIVDKIQRQLGVDVVVSAGNKGPDRFSWDFLTAKQRLGSTDASGNQVESSATGSSKSQGQFPLVYHNLNVFSPEPLANQLGFYNPEGTKIRYRMLCIENQKSPTFTSDFFRGSTSDSQSGEPGADEAKTSMPQVRVLPSRPWAEGVSRLELLQKPIPAGLLDGTSFANITWYPKHKSVRR